MDGMNITCSQFFAACTYLPKKNYIFLTHLVKKILNCNDVTIR